MNLIEFVDRYNNRVFVNADKVLSLYQNDAPFNPQNRGDNSHKGAWTFIETAGTGADGEDTGPVVKHTIDEVAQRLQGQVPVNNERFIP